MCILHEYSKIATKKRNMFQLAREAEVANIQAQERQQCRTFGNHIEKKVRNGWKTITETKSNLTKSPTTWKLFLAALFLMILLFYY